MYDWINRDDMVNEITTSAGIGKSDHIALIINLACYSQEELHSTRLNYTKADFDQQRRFLGGVNWIVDLDGLDVEATWALIKHRINEAIQESVPLTKVTGHRGKRWMDKETLASVRKKHKLFRHWQETQDGQDCLLYSRARNQASKACKKAKKQLEKKVVQDAKKYPKAFWSFVKSKTQTKKGVADLKLPNGEKTKNDQEKADLLNQFFHNVFHPGKR